MSVHVLPYDPGYDTAIQHFEDGILHGKGIVLKMLKNHFLDRSKPFTKVFPVLALTENGTVAGTAIGAATKLSINGIVSDVGYGFDVKVHPAHRNKGVGKGMANYIQKNFFQGFQKNFITLKMTNTPVVRLSARVAGKIWLYDFVYLTIPTQVRIAAAFAKTKAPLFAVKLFDENNLPPGFHTTLASGLSFFHTDRLYRLKIEKINFLYKNALQVLRWIQPSKYAGLPAEKDVMEFVTLFNHTEENIGHMNEVLRCLEKENKRYLLVCCRKGDSIYQYLKNYSINTYGYCMLTDFPLKETDAVNIDVRCL